jgi:hypothetical protein
MVNQGKALVNALLGQVPAQYSTCPIIQLSINLLDKLCRINKSV